MNRLPRRLMGISAAKDASIQYAAGRQGDEQRGIPRRFPDPCGLCQVVTEKYVQFLRRDDVALARVLAQGLHLRGLSRISFALFAPRSMMRSSRSRACHCREAGNERDRRLRLISFFVPSTTFQLTFTPEEISSWAMRDSNARPMAPEAIALSN